MAKGEKRNHAAADHGSDAPEKVEPESVVEPKSVVERVETDERRSPGCKCQRDRLWELYVARVTKAETVNTMRRDGKAIFRDAFIEAKCAHEVWAEMINGGNEK